MRKLPLAIATAAVIATQIACTLWLSRQPQEVVVDQVPPLVYDGKVIRAELRHETHTVGRLALTEGATIQLHEGLLDLLAAQAR